jgi:hypothetical protein
MGRQHILLGPDFKKLIIPIDNMNEHGLNDHYGVKKFVN